jgi:hypothetical protein
VRRARGPVGKNAVGHVGASTVPYGAWCSEAGWLAGCWLAGDRGRSMVVVGPNCLGTGTGCGQQDERGTKESEAERKAVPSIGERGRKSWRRGQSFAPHWHAANQAAGTAGSVSQSLVSSMGINLSRIDAMMHWRNFLLLILGLVSGDGRPSEQDGNLCFHLDLWLQNG